MKAKYFWLHGNDETEFETVQEMLAFSEQLRSEGARIITCVFRNPLSVKHWILFYEPNVGEMKITKVPE